MTDDHHAQDSRLRCTGRRHRQGASPLRPPRAAQAAADRCRPSPLREADLDRLETITAFKYLGFSLKQIEGILNGRRRAAKGDRASSSWDSRPEVAARRHQEGARSRAAVLDAGWRGPLGGALDRLTEVVHTRAAAAAMRKYYTEEGWERRRRYYEEGPDVEWRELYRTLSALVGEDPASERVQAATGSLARIVDARLHR